MWKLCQCFWPVQDEKVTVIAIFWHLSTISCPAEIFHFVSRTHFITILSEMSANSSSSQKSPSKMKKKHLVFFSALKPQYQTKLKMTLLSVALPLTHSLTIALWDAPQWPHRISHKKLWEGPKLGYASQNFFNQHATCTAIAEAKWMDSSFSMLFNSVLVGV